jgi:hypothetical protein
MPLDMEKPSQCGPVAKISLDHDFRARLTLPAGKIPDDVFWGERSATIAAHECLSAGCGKRDDCAIAAAYSNSVSSRGIADHLREQGVLDTGDVRPTPPYHSAAGVSAAEEAQPAVGAPLNVVLGRRLRRLRVRRGVSRKILSARLRVAVTHVEGHECGTKKIEAHELLAYARFFGVRISSFFRAPGDSEMTRPPIPRSSRPH